MLKKRTVSNDNSAAASAGTVFLILASGSEGFRPKDGVNPETRTAGLFKCI